MNRLVIFFVILMFGYGAPVQAADGERCGGLEGSICEGDTFCQYAPDQFCGIADQIGMCVPTQVACTQPVIPVCGCDGTVYSNACTAQQQGVSVAYVGVCRSKPNYETMTCQQVISCGLRDGENKQYPTPCDAHADGATNVKPREGDACPAAK